MRPVGIVGIGMYVPPQVVTNKDFEKIVDTSDDWIVSRTGIRERRRASQEMSTSDMCMEAAVMALEDAGVAAEEVDLIIVGTVTPDYLFPATACLVQKRLGATRAAAFDLEAGCTGFVYGLTVGQQFIVAGMYKTVLVIGAETLSRVSNWADRSTCVLFGDGAGAAVLQAVPEGYGILSSTLGSDGDLEEALIQPGGGAKMPASLESVQQGLHTIHMRGSDVFKFAVRVMGEAALEAIEKAGLTKDQIDFLIPHQANNRIVEAALRRLNLPWEKVYVNLDRYGNMSAASVPVALCEALREGKIKQGDIVVLVAFGAGLTWAASVIRWWKGEGR
ncbi:MAG: beta-ketoacyl-ACP synthase III [Bacillota bacterium]